MQMFDDAEKAPYKTGKKRWDRPSGSAMQEATQALHGLRREKKTLGSEGN